MKPPEWTRPEDQAPLPGASRSWRIRAPALRRWLDSPGGGNLWGRGSHDEYVQNNFVGTAEQVAEKVQGYVDAGCREFVLWFRDYPSSDSLERFMREVVPQVRV